MFKELNPLLHSELRLAVMSILLGVEEADFVFIREQTGASAGNLSVQIDKLQKAGYITVEKTFRGKMPRTLCRITPTGVDAFEEYVEALKSYIKSRKENRFSAPAATTTGSEWGIKVVMPHISTPTSNPAESPAGNLPAGLLAATTGKANSVNQPQPRNFGEFRIPPYANKPGVSLRACLHLFFKRLVLELRREELPVQTGDVRNRNHLRTLGLASSRIGTVTEAQFVHLGHHRLGAAGTLDTSLRQFRERRHTGGDEKHRRAVLTGRSAGTATDAGSGIHRNVGIGLRDGNVVGILHGIRTDRDEAAGLKNLIVGTAIHHEVLDYGESRRTPGLDDDRRPVFETAHVNLAGRGAVARAVRTAVDVQRAHTADTLAAVVVERHGLLALVDQVVVQNIQHLEKRGVGGDVLDFVGFECPFCLGVFLAPYL